MGWSADDFWFSTPSFFYAAWSGFNEREYDLSIERYTQARTVAFWAAIGSYLENPKALKPTDIFRLPGEEERTPVFDPISPEEMAAFSAAADKAYLQLAGKEWQVSHN